MDFEETSRLQNQTLAFRVCLLIYPRSSHNDKAEKRNPSISPERANEYDSCLFLPLHAWESALGTILLRGTAPIVIVLLIGPSELLRRSAEHVTSPNPGVLGQHFQDSSFDEPSA